MPDDDEACTALLDAAREAAVLEAAMVDLIVNSATAQLHEFGASVLAELSADKSRKAVMV